ncbi:hypothetical protein CR513_36593, partial [Mucuna pruriens]
MDPEIGKPNQLPLGLAHSVVQQPKGAKRPKHSGLIKATQPRHAHYSLIQLSCHVTLGRNLQRKEEFRPNSIFINTPFSHSRIQHKRWCKVLSCVSLNRGGTGQELGSGRLLEGTAWRSQCTLMDLIISVLTIDDEPSLLSHGDRHVTKKQVIKLATLPRTKSVLFNTWGDMKLMFLETFFPASRTAPIRKEICGIRQHSRETLHKYWERFNKLCTTCPHHQINEKLLIQYFYEDLPESREHLGLKGASWLRRSGPDQDRYQQRKSLQHTRNNA